MVRNVLAASFSGVVALGDDAVEELAALAELHDDVDVLAALVRVDELDDVGVVA